MPSRHLARGITKTSLVVHGEAHIDLSFEDQTLPVTALVVDIHDCDILVGVPFCAQHNVVPLMKKQQVLINGSVYHYGKSARRPSVHDILKVDSFVLRNDRAKVILPGDFYEFHSTDWLQKSIS